VTRVVPAGLLAGLVTSLITGCGAEQGATRDASRTLPVPSSQSAAARALRLPRMQLAPVSSARIGNTVVVRVVSVGSAPPDTAIQTRAVDPACGDSFVDTAVVRHGAAIVGALVWVEGPTPVKRSGVGEHRPTVILEQCQLRPRMQIAELGSTIQLVTRDPRAEQLVIVPPSISTPIDTVRFIADGQIVPVRGRADSSGVVAVHALTVPWARAYIATTPLGLSAITNADGVATFIFDATGTSATVRAWHPSLGVASVTFNPGATVSPAVVTITFKR